MPDEADETRREEAEARERLREVEAKAHETLEEAEELESKHEPSAGEPPERASEA